MKKIVFAFVFSVGVAVTAAAEAEEYGDEIVAWPKNHGTFLFVNAQNRLSESLLNGPITALSSDFFIDVRLVKGAGAVDIRSIPAELKGLGAKGGIWIVDDPALPISLSASEDGWGIMNVSPILADSADEKILSMRVQKFVNRTFASVNGIGDSTMMPACVMKQAVGIAGVDGLKCATYSPEAFSKITSYLELFGYKRCRRGTYYEACEEGWAPAPTNAAQKAIWDKVHQFPTKPLTIQRESERRRKK